MWIALAVALVGSALVAFIYNTIAASNEGSVSAEQADGFNIAIDTQAGAPKAPAAPAPEAAAQAASTSPSSGLGMVGGASGMQFGYASPPPGSASGPGKLGPNKGGKVDEGAVMGKIMNSNPNLQNAEQNPGGAIK